MATKKKTTSKKKSTTADPYTSALKQMNADSNKTQLQIQKLVNSANTAQMKYNSQEAQKARDWQTKMSSTSHQMEVKDLKKAGLNPVLSANNGGAQSYTTSSAAAQPESGASALASLAESQIGALGNMESSRISANSALKSAEMSAKATKYAAEQSAQAQMFAAQQSYAATKYASDVNRYSADRQYAASKYSSDTQADIAAKQRANDRYIMKHQNANTWAAFLDKHLRNSGVTGKAYRTAKKYLSWDSPAAANYGFTNGSGKKVRFELFKNKPQLGKKNLGLTMDNYKLNRDGYAYTKSWLRKLGYTPTNKNVHRFVKAVFFHVPSAGKQMVRITPVKTRQHVRR